MSDRQTVRNIVVEMLFSIKIRRLKFECRFLLIYVVYRLFCPSALLQKSYTFFYRFRDFIWGFAYFVFFSFFSLLYNLLFPLVHHIFFASLCMDVAILVSWAKTLITHKIIFLAQLLIFNISYLRVFVGPIMFVLTMCVFSSAENRVV